MSPSENKVIIIIIIIIEGMLGRENANIDQ